MLAYFRYDALVALEFQLFAHSALAEANTPSIKMSETIAYTVQATFTDCKVADEWIGWLENGHLAEVIKGGATDAEIIHFDGDDCRYEVRYHFPSRESFRAYETNHAPRLRADGLAKFPTSRGITYARSTGVVI